MKTKMLTFGLAEPERQEVVGDDAADEPERQEVLDC